MNIFSHFAQVFRPRRKEWRAPPMSPEIRELRKRYDIARMKHLNTKPIFDKLKKAQAARLRGDTK